ncbi:4-hydroxybenzoate 3-monooxygenase [Kitasatospora sp. NPDC053057]|uniref:4-hydroxybenzoate 3-monooxygenase n=1 Tax=Kitasatospora sp. NPDC053057 TaxID=3364062 RepID=UPI0037C984EF
MTSPGRTLHTPVCIIGAGPSGLLLARLLRLNGIDSVVLERRTRVHVEKRVRAGLLEQGTVEILRDAGVGERLDREALVHEGFEWRLDGAVHRMPFTELCGASVWMYGQQEVVKDLLDAHDDEAGLHFGVEDVRIASVTADGARVVCTIDGQLTELTCDFIAGCDGFHGVSRQAVPGTELVGHELTHPFAWLGVLAAAPPLSPELIYAVGDRGFALQSMRSQQVSRLYLSVPPGEGVDDRSDEEIWRELDLRLAGGRGTLPTGEILERVMVPLRSYVAEPFQYRRLFLVGDAAHIVPPSAAKGLNMAVADARHLAEALTGWYAHGRREALDGYSATAVPRAWQGQQFSASMTTLMHAAPDESVFDRRLRRARFERLLSSTAEATAFAEQYTGIARR